MKIKAIITSRIEIEIEGITLLSIEEYEKYKNNIRPIVNWWWLRSPGYYSYDAAIVDYDGSVYSPGSNVNHRGGAVRPVLKGNFSNIHKFEFANYSWIVLSKNLAICETFIALRRFDNTSNDFANSEVKEFLEDWLKNV